MKIAIFTSGSLPVPAVQGGAIENLVDFLLEYNESQKLHDITVYSILPTVPLPLNVQTPNNHYVFVDTHSFWARLKRRLYAFRHKDSFYYNYFIEYYLHESLKHFRKHNFDVVIIESRPGYATAVRSVSDARIVVHLHNDWMSNTDAKVLHARACINKVLTVSDFLRSRVNVINDGLLCQTVHNGIDLTRFYNAQAMKRANLHLDSDDLLLVYSGRLNENKGIKELIAAMKVLKNHNKLKLLVIGGSFFGKDTMPDPFIISLKKDAEELAGSIIFTGFVPYQDIPSYLKMADVAVIPSVWDDPFPTTILEAMATGLPLITTNSGGIPESATKGGAIILDREKDLVQELASAILKMEDKQFRRELSAKSLEGSKLFHKDDYACHFFDSLF